MAFPHRLDAPELPDFSMLKRLARDQLIYLLEQLPGKKDLFIEADLMSPLDRIANVSILKQHEVDKLYKVENKPAVSSSEQLCFLVRPRIKNMRYVASLVNADKLAGRTRKYKVIFSPQKFHACEMVLEEEGVYGAPWGTAVMRCVWCVSTRSRFSRGRWGVCPFHSPQYPQCPSACAC
uniref:Vacuolar protein sorting-associated protein 33B n=1 Tax=Felis catus TaxID=9685 RepID=A0ABI7YHR8_FELCA